MAVWVGQWGHLWDRQMLLARKCLGLILPGPRAACAPGQQAREESLGKSLVCEAWQGLMKEAGAGMVGTSFLVSDADMSGHEAQLAYNFRSPGDLLSASHMSLAVSAHYIC